jgi:hypothetical protein
MKKILLLLLLLISTQILYAHGISDADKQAMLNGGYFEYVILGMKHMLTGYDHLLFLFGVMFFLKNFKSIFILISAFTLGHSITLVFATFLEITANYYLVDAIIALTIIYKAFDNLDGFKKYININIPNIAVMVFIFGLIHGFGLSTRLQQLPLGHDGFLFRILSFNIGVEIGQIIALSVIFIILGMLRKLKLFNNFSFLFNILLMFAGLLLFTYQMTGFFNGEMHSYDESAHHLHDNKIEKLRNNSNEVEHDS